MNSVILQTATRYLMPLMLLFSIVVLLQGHNKPGGGFIGGLVGATAFALHAIAFNAHETRRALRIDMRTLIGVGLLIALASGMLGPIYGLPLMTGMWTELAVPGVGPLKVGTPLLFDVGVYLVVLGTAILMVLLLVEE
jgi:multicomponent Na+:H+ antiporter subunit B